jgi:hypothetical protein
MRLTHTLLAGAAVLGLASTAAAQGRAPAPKKAEPKVRISAPEECKTEDGKVECTFRRVHMDSALMKRAALGIQLSSTGTMRDTLGVFVASVTPKGPAENAGIYEGDRIVSFNGVDLRVNSADAGDSYAAGLPARRLTREVQKLAPGNTATLRVWSGGRTRDVQVTLGRASDLRERSFGFFGGEPGAYIMRDMFREGGPLRMKIAPRIRMQDFPRLRYQELPKLRMQDFPMLRFEDMPGFEHDFDLPMKTPEPAKEKKRSAST